MLAYGRKRLLDSCEGTAKFLRWDTWRRPRLRRTAADWSRTPSWTVSELRLL